MDPTEQNDQNKDGDQNANDQNKEEIKKDSVFEMDGSDGKKVIYTSDELKQRFQELEDKVERAAEKERGADAKFRASSDGRKAGEALSAFKAYQQEGTIDSLEALRPFASQFGWTSKDIDDAQADILTEQKGDDKGGDKGGKPAGNKAQPLTMDDLPREAQEAVASKQAEGQARMVATAHKRLDMVLDKDPVFGHIMVGKEPELAPIAKRIREHARQVLVRRAQEAVNNDRDTWTANVRGLQEVSQEVRAWLNDLYAGSATQGSPDNRGTPGDRTGTPAMPTGSFPVSSALHRPKSKPLERPDSRDAGAYREYVAEKARRVLNGEEDADE